MRQMLVLFLLLLAACAQKPQPQPAPAAESGAEFGSWRLHSGKAPTRLEFAALLAACKEGGKTAALPIDRCLLALGLRRAP